MATVWELDGIKKGRMEAKVTTWQATLVRIIRKRFGKTIKATTAKTEKITACQRLDEMIDSVLDVTQLTDTKT